MMVSVRRQSPFHWFLFVSIRIILLAPFSFLTLSSFWDNEWLPWLSHLQTQESKHDPEPLGSSPWDLPIYELTHLILCVHCVVKIQALNFKFKLNLCSTYFSNGGGKKTQKMAIVILFCLIPYGFVSRFTRKTGYNYWFSSWTKWGIINKWTFLF